MTSVCQGVSSLPPGGGKMRDPGNEVETAQVLAIEKSNNCALGYCSFKTTAKKKNFDRHVLRKTLCQEFFNTPLLQLPWHFELDVDS